jgi:type II secretory pathway component PulF
VRSKTASKTAGKGGQDRIGRAKGRVKVKYVTQFARQLSTLQDAGLPILRSLRILQEQQKGGNFKRIIGYVADDIEGGSTLSEAMAKYSRAFDRLFVNMVAAGETGGVLDLILSRIADFKEKAIRLRARVKSAMIYPMVVLGAAFLIVLGLMKFVIPSFKTVLVEMVEGKLTRSLRCAGRTGLVQYGGGMTPFRSSSSSYQVVRKFVRAAAGHDQAAGACRRADQQQGLHHAMDQDARDIDQRRRADS